MFPMLHCPSLLSQGSETLAEKGAPITLKLPVALTLSHCRFAQVSPGVNTEWVQSRLLHKVEVYT